MAWFEVNSPHNGRPVRVRDKDVGRSVRDGDGRVFYVLERSEGDGHYSSLTRQGGPEHEATYDEMLAKESHAKNVAAVVTEKQVHDATGGKRSSVRGKMVILFLAVVVAFLAYLFTIGPLGSGSWPWTAPPNTKDASTKDAPAKDAPTKDAAKQNPGK